MKTGEGRETKREGARERQRDNGEEIEREREALREEGDRE